MKLFFFKKGKTCLVVKFHTTDVNLWDRSRDGNTAFDSLINMVFNLLSSEIFSDAEKMLAFSNEAVLKRKKFLSVPFLSFKSCLHWRRSQLPSKQILIKLFPLLKWQIKGLLHCFSTCTEMTRNNWYCFILKNVENCKEKFQRVKKL